MLIARQWAGDTIAERVRLHGLTFARDAAIVASAYVLAELWRFSNSLPTHYLNDLLVAVPVAVAAFLAFLYTYGIHRRLWKFAGASDIRALTEASFFATMVLLIFDLVDPLDRPLPVTVVPVGGIFALAGLIGVRFWSSFFHAQYKDSDADERLLIVGAGSSGQHVAAELLASRNGKQRPVGFLDDRVMRGMRIHGLAVLGTIDDLPRIVEEQRIDVIGVAIASASTKSLDRIIELAQQTPSRIQVVPSRDDVIAGRADLRLRDVNLDDLLDRVPTITPAQQELVSRTLMDRTVLVTGARGSIGAELCRQILQFGPSRLIAVDNNESGLVYIQQDLSREPHAARLVPVLADITDARKIGNVFERYKPDVVFHAAAYKHVHMLEAFPEEAVFVNVFGTLNLCRLAHAYGCERFVFISTDKAVHPAGVLGFSKRIGELTVRAHQRPESPVFCCVRFGNVIGSRGSALPEFIRQIDAGGPVTVTHPDVERYFMTIPEAVNLVIQAGAFARGGELFMLEMGAQIKIADLVKRLIRLRGLRVGKDIEIVFTGLRPGEKMSEELVFDKEETQPTANPEVFAVNDELHPDQSELEDQIEALLELAQAGDRDQIIAALKDVAYGQHVWPAQPMEVAG